MWKEKAQTERPIAEVGDGVAAEVCTSSAVRFYSTLFVGSVHPLAITGVRPFTRMSSSTSLHERVRCHTFSTLLF
jgi:hypothetical protein